VLHSFTKWSDAALAAMCLILPLTLLASLHGQHLPRDSVSHTSQAQTMMSSWLTTSVPTLWSPASPPMTQCAAPIHICGMEVAADEAALGSTLQLRLHQYYEANFECAMIDGAARWVPTGAHGSCTPAPIVILPDHYSDDPSTIG
jgi:hypothetical protein